jgi:hypothetical protein
MTDNGGAMRGLAEKIAAIRRAVSDEHRVAGLLVVRSTTRNGAIVGAMPAVFSSRFPAASGAWLAALGDSAIPMPTEDGFLWSATNGSRLFAARLR